MNAPFGRQLKLISLLFNCFPYFKEAKIPMLEFAIFLGLDMYSTQSIRISKSISELFDVLIMIKCLQLL